MHVHHDRSQRVIVTVGFAATLIAAVAAHHPDHAGSLGHPPAQSIVTH